MAATRGPVTDDRDRGVRSYMWSRDSRRIIWSQDRGGDENHHLLRLRADGGGADPRPHALPGVRAGMIAAPRATPRHILVSMNLRDRTLFDAYRLTLATGRLELIGRNPGNILAWLADRDGRLRRRARPDAGGRLRAAGARPRGEDRVVMARTPTRTAGTRSPSRRTGRGCGWGAPAAAT